MYSPLLLKSGDPMSTSTRPSTEKAPSRRAANRKPKKSKQGQGPQQATLSVVAPPVAVGYNLKSRAPKMSTKKNSIRVQRDRELVNGQILQSTSFAVQATYPIQPGAPSAFPWLSSTAKNWEQYTIHSLVYHYIPIAPTSTQGDIIFSPQYDATDPVPGSEFEAMNTQDAQTFPVWMKCDIRLDPKSLMGLGPKRFTRSTNVAGDLKTFDCGFISVFSNNCTSDVNAAGKLLVSYDIEFFNPQTESAPGGVVQNVGMFGPLEDFAISDSTTIGCYLNKTYSNPLGWVVDGMAQKVTPTAGTYLIHVDVRLDNVNNTSNFLTVDLIKNNLSLDFQHQARVSSPASVQEYLCLHLMGLVSFNGSDTFAIAIFVDTGDGNAANISCKGTRFSYMLA